MQTNTIRAGIGVLVLAAAAASAAAAQATTQAPAKAPPKAPAKAAEMQKPAAPARGYSMELPAKLVAKAKVTEAAAAATALASVPGGKITGGELEEEDGKFIYSYDISVAGKKGVQEVHVDAMSGAVIKSVHEDPSKEGKEEAEEGKAGKAATKAPAKAPVKKPPTPPAMQS